ncbi:ANK3 [Symbiodinium sp. KB8]|nr:ANK3 [Symbiodinium sp. KB8]
MATAADCRLREAVRNSNLQQVKSALQQGASPHAFSTEPLLTCAVEKRSEEVVQALLDAGALVNETSSSLNITAFWKACMLGEVGLARLLLDHGADPALKSSSGASGALVAIEFGHEGIIDLLLEIGADIFEPRDDGSTALGVAISWDQTALALRLLNLGADAQQASAGGWLPLHIAGEKGNVPVIKALLLAGAEVDMPGPQDETALWTACRGGNLEAAKVLHEAGADPSAQTGYGASCAFIACESGSLPVLNWLAGLGVDVLVKRSGNDATPLGIALSKNHTDVALRLLELGADPNQVGENGWYALHIAVEKDMATARRELLRADADAAYDDEQSCLEWAIEHGMWAHVRALLEAGARMGPAPGDSAESPGEKAAQAALMHAPAGELQRCFEYGWDASVPFHNGDSVLHVLVRREESLNGVIKVLTQHGAQVQAENAEGLSPCMVAVMAGKADVVTALLEAGADAAEPLPTGESLLHRALEDKAEGCVLALLEHGAEVDGTFKYGDGPLHHAIRHNMPRAVEALLAHSASATEPNAQEDTPLHLAVQFCLQVCAPLVRRGADLHAEDGEGLTAAEVAESQGLTEAVQELEQLEAQQPSSS